MGDKISEVNPKTRQNIVEMLKSLLVDAEKGEIQSLAVAGVNYDASTFNVFDTHYAVATVLGELRVLERDIIDLRVDIRKNISWDYAN